MIAAALVVILATGPGVDPRNWYVRQVCEVMPEHPCIDWRSWEARRCSDDPEDRSACVRLTHPTAFGGRPHDFRAVFDSGLASLSVVLRDGRLHPLWSR